MFKRFSAKIFTFIDLLKANSVAFVVKADQWGTLLVLLYFILFYFYSVVLQNDS